MNHEAQIPRLHDPRGDPVTALNLTLPAHRAELLWACRLSPEALRESIEHMRRNPRGASFDEYTLAAAECVANPSIAAEVLRGLLKWMGINAQTREHTFFDRVVIDVDRLSDNEARASVDMRSLPTLFLSLLAIPEGAADRREQALAVLREAGR